MRFILFMLLFLAGCAQDYEIRLMPLDEVRDARNCGNDVLPNFGCWRKRDARGGCIVIAEDARDTADTERLATIGKEVWKCIHSNKEY